MEKCRMRDNTGTPAISEIQTSRPGAKSRLKNASQTLSNGGVRFSFRPIWVLLFPSFGGDLGPEALPLINIVLTGQLLQYIVWTRGKTHHKEACPNKHSSDTTWILKHRPQALECNCL